jgi:3-hydroxyisobutyrate dehydrogenase-like beta-hydroxyacid dehydrogenase
MSGFTRVCLIGFGEVGQLLADDLTAAGVAHLTAFDILFSTKNSNPAKALEGRSVHAAPNAPEAALGCDLIISAVTAASELDAALSVVRGLSPGAFYVDLNSVSPRAKRQACAVIQAAGGKFVEVAVMSPFAPKRIASPMLLGGHHAQEFRDRAQPLGFTGAEVFSDEIGPASATKMCRSVLIKGVEALLTESMLAARLYGVEETVLRSLTDLLPVPHWEKLARYMISRSLEHGTRRGEEMREVAQTVRDAGVEPVMSMAIAERQYWAAAYRSALSEEHLGEMLDHILDDTEPQRAVGKG